MRPVLRASCVIVGCGAAGAAFADPPRAAVSTTYVAPPACPTEAEFAKRLLARLVGPRGAERPRRSLVVRITGQADGQFVGRLSLVTAEGGSTTKTLAAHNCDELVDALSLVAALALQTDETAVSGGDLASAPSAASAAPAGARSAAPAPPGPPAASASATAAVPREVQETRPGEGSENEDRSLRLALQLGGLAALGVAPNVLVGGGLGLDWAPLATGPFRPALGLGVVAAAAPDVVRSDGRASFVWLAARVNACALRFDFGRSAALRVCGLADIGVVNARGSDTVDPRSSSRGWLSLGVSSQAEFPLSERFALVALVGAEAPLRRDLYAFGPSDFFLVPLLIATGSMSVAAYFR